MKTDEQLKQLAIDAWAGRIFAIDAWAGRILTSVDIPEGADIALVFPILLTMDKDQRQKLFDQKPFLFYEYLDKTAPDSVKGMPSFSSMQWLTEHEFSIFLDFLSKIKDI